MDGVGKKSLSDSGEKMAKAQQKKIQLHYFPDIPVGTSKVRPECVTEKNTFKRIHFDANGPSCSDKSIKIISE